MNLIEILTDLQARIRALPAARQVQVLMFDEATTAFPQLIVLPRNQTPTVLDLTSQVETEFEVTIRHSPKDYAGFLRNTDITNPDGLLHQLFALEPDGYPIGWEHETPRMPVDAIEGQAGRLGYQMTTAMTISHSAEPDIIITPSEVVVYCGDASADRLTDDPIGTFQADVSFPGVGPHALYGEVCGQHVHQLLFTISGGPQRRLSVEFSEPQALGALLYPLPGETPYDSSENLIGIQLLQFGNPDVSSGDTITATLKIRAPAETVNGVNYAEIVKELTMQVEYQ